jgi:hypothetical protein
MLFRLFRVEPRRLTRVSRLALMLTSCHMRNLRRNGWERSWQLTRVSGETVLPSVI